MLGQRSTKMEIRGVGSVDHTEDKHGHEGWGKQKKTSHVGEEFKNILKAEMEKQNVSSK